MILEKIQSELKSCGISRYQIEAETGIDQTILFRLYHGTGGCTVETLDTLCKYFGLELQAKAKLSTKPMKRRPK